VNEWLSLEVITPVLTASNELQYEIHKMRRKLEYQLGRGKRYQMNNIPADIQEKWREKLLRHSKTCHALERHGQFPICYSSFPDPKHKGVWWVIDEWIEGRTLADVLESGPLSPTLLPRVMREIAIGLKGLHDREIVRRELSPQSIVLREADSSVVLTDLELAKFLDDTPTVSEKWEPDPYRAPEAEGKDVNPQADIYSWGRIFVHAATGELPDEGKEAAVLAKTNLPDAVVRIVQQCVLGPRSHRPKKIDRVIRAIRTWK
jgi:serine/threonine protein kinase